MNSDQRMDTEGNPFIHRSHRLYGCLLTAYPKRHREEYGPPMQQVFRDQCRDAWREARGWGLMGLWLRVLPDLVKTSVLEHLATLNERKSMIEKLAAVLRPRSTPSAVFLRVFVFVFLLVAATTTLVTFLLPESYASATRIRIERDVTDIRGLTEPQFNTAYDPYFMQTEFKVLQSQPVLTRVISDLDLATVWGKKYAAGEKLKESEALTLLRGRMDLRPVRNTSLIEIRVFSEDAGEAARIANAIAETYRDYRLEQHRQLSLGGLRVLEDRFEEQEKKVQRAQHEVDGLRRELGIAEADASSTSPAPILTAETLRRLDGLRIESEAQYAREEKLFQQLKKTPPEELKRVLPTVAPDPQLNDLLSQLNIVEQSLIQMNKDVADTHPSVITAKRQTDALNRKIQERTDGILKGMELRVASLKEHWESLTSSVQKAKEADVSNAAKTRPYFEAKQRLDELTRFRSILNMKLASEKIDIDLPKTTLVEIVDRAEPGLRPIRPNKPLNIVSGVLGGGLTGLAAAMVITWLVNLLGKGTGGGATAAASSQSAESHPGTGRGPAASSAEKVVCGLWMVIGTVLSSLAVAGMGSMVVGGGGWFASEALTVVCCGLFWGIVCGMAYFLFRGESWARTYLRLITVGCAASGLLVLGLQQGWLSHLVFKSLGLLIAPLLNALLPLPVELLWLLVLFASFSAVVLLRPRKKMASCPA